MKICPVCKKERELNQFRPNALKCKTCNRDVTRTKEGLAKRIWHGQKSSSKNRGHEMPRYTQSEFIGWFLSQPNLDKLHSDWVLSGYQRSLRPSSDRIDDSKGYSFDNIQLITFGENCKKPQLAKCKPVIQYDLDMNKLTEYYSLNYAAKQICGSMSSISNCCKGRIENHKGFIWRYK